MPDSPIYKAALARERRIEAEKNIMVGILMVGFCVAILALLTSIVILIHFIIKHW